MKIRYSYHPLNFIDVNDILYCVLHNGTFTYRIMMPVKLCHHFENNHSEFREEELSFKCFKCRFYELFKNQKLKQFFKL